MQPYAPTFGSISVVEMYAATPLPPPADDAIATQQQQRTPHYIRVHAPTNTLTSAETEEVSRFLAGIKKPLALSWHPDALCDKKDRDLRCRLCCMRILGEQCLGGLAIFGGGHRNPCAFVVAGIVAIYYVFVLAAYLLMLLGTTLLCLFSPWRALGLWRFGCCVDCCCPNARYDVAPFASVENPWDDIGSWRDVRIEMALDRPLGMDRLVVAGTGVPKRSDNGRPSLRLQTAQFYFVSSCGSRNGVAEAARTRQNGRGAGNDSTSGARRGPGNTIRLPSTDRPRAASTASTVLTSSSMSTAITTSTSGDAVSAAHIRPRSLVFYRANVCVVGLFNFESVFCMACATFSVWLFYIHWTASAPFAAF